MLYDSLAGCLETAGMGGGGIQLECEDDVMGWEGVLARAKSVQRDWTIKEEKERK